MNGRAKAFAKNLAAVVLGIVAAIASLEILCQLLFALLISQDLDAQRQSPLHYYVASPDPVLQYRLKPGFRADRDGRRMAINRHGIRDDSDGAEAAQRVALVGDSVVFGIGLSQEETATAHLQRLVGAGTKVLNYGTPGYGLEEIAHYLPVADAAYRAQRVYYVLNLNDFSRRETMFEGADNGLYRMYRRPLLKAPFLLRKAVYRLVKGGQATSVRWYRWLYEGNRNAGLELIRRMAAYSRENGASFTVVLFPPGVAYESEGFALRDAVDDLGAALERSGVRLLAPVADFGRNTLTLIDNTDHLTAPGCELMAFVIWQDLRQVAGSENLRQ